MAIEDACAECTDRLDDFRAELKELEETPPTAIDDETVFYHHYVTEALSWIEDCASQEPMDDGSCPIGTTCHGGWGPCTCGCRSWFDDDCQCVLCEALAKVADGV